MTEFEVHGPYKIPCEEKSHGRLIKTGCPRFWTEDKAHLADERGCYVFCIRASKGYRPIYVGRTTKMSFRREAFGHHKIADHYVPALMDVHRGRLSFSSLSRRLTRASSTPRTSVSLRRSLSRQVPRRIQTSAMRREERSPSGASVGSHAAGRGSLLGHLGISGRRWAFDSRDSVADGRIGSSSADSPARTRRVLPMPRTIGTGDPFAI